MQKCKHCNQDYEPKQQYCSTKCRVYSKRGNESVTKSVTKVVQSVTKPLQSVTQVIQKEPISNAIVTDNTPRKIVENVKPVTEALQPNDIRDTPRTPAGRPYTPGKAIQWCAKHKGSTTLTCGC